MKTLTLTSAEITRDDKPLETVQLREPKAGDLRGLKLLDLMQFDIDAMAVLLPRLSTPALTTQDVYAMNFRDITAATEAVASFFGSMSDSLDASKT